VAYGLFFKEILSFVNLDFLSRPRTSKQWLVGVTAVVHLEKPYVKQR
jgi:hypothetical protein